MEYLHLSKLHDTLNGFAEINIHMTFSNKNMSTLNDKIYNLENKGKEQVKFLLRRGRASVLPSALTFQLFLLHYVSKSSETEKLWTNLANYVFGALRS